MIDYANIGRPPKELIGDSPHGAGSPEGVVAAQRGGTYAQRDADGVPPLFAKLTASGTEGWERLQLDLRRVDVRLFGAKGDGITDDTAAVLDALEYLISTDGDRRELFFPPGTYLISETLRNTLHFVYFKGAGQRVTFIDWVPSESDEFEDESCTSSAEEDFVDRLYLIDDATLRPWVRDDIVIKDGGVEVDPETDPYELMPTTGEILFATEATRTVTVSGRRFLQCFLFSNGFSTVPPSPNHGGRFESSQLIYGGGVEGITIFSSDFTKAKIGIDVIDVSRPHVRDVEVRFNGAVLIEGEYPDSISGSICVVTRGRDMIDFKRCTLRGYLPILIGYNPNYATICADHYLIEDVYTIADRPNGYNLEIEDRCVLSNTTFRQMITALGAGAFRYADTRVELNTVGDPVITYLSQNVIVDGCRHEQTTGDEPGWLWYSTATIWIFALVNCYAAHGGNGVYLRNVIAATLRYMFANFGEWSGAIGDEDDVGGGLLTPSVALDVDDCFEITGTACRFVEWATVNYGSRMELVWESPRIEQRQRIGGSFIIANKGNSQALTSTHQRLIDATFVNGAKISGTAPYFHPTSLSATSVEFGTGVDGPEATTTSDDQNYKHALRHKATWEAGTVAVYIDGVEADPEGADPFTVQPTIGNVSFASPDAGRGVVTVDGMYYPVTTWGGRNKQDDLTNWSVEDDGTFVARTALRAPSIIGTGPNHQFGLRDTDFGSSGTTVVILGKAGKNRMLQIRSGEDAFDEDFPLRVGYGCTASSEAGGSDAGSDGLWVVYKNDGTVGGTITFYRATGKLVMSGALETTKVTLSDAVSKLIAGPTSFAVRKSDDSSNLLLVTSDGDVTVLRDLSVTRNAAVSGNLTVTGTITSGVWSATVIAAAKGGTGQASYAVGDLLFASGTTALSTRAIGATDDVLTVVAGEPAWVNLDTATRTLTNKRVTPRRATIESSATPTIDTDDVDRVSITALATAITSMTANLTGTPTPGDELALDITDDGTARAIAWGADFEASGTLALPTTTVAGVRLDLRFVRNAATSKWRLILLA